MKRFENFVAYVTGASSGIGLQIARAFAEEGAGVALIGLGRDILEQEAEALRSNGAQAIAIECNVTDSEALRASVEATVQALGQIDCSIAAAGVAIKGTVTEAPEKDWHANIGVNLTGTYLTARHTMPHLLRSKRASFIGIASDAGVRGSTGYTAYSASKHGVIGLVRCLALDYGPKGVRSNVICPSFVDTPMADDLLSEQSTYDRAFYEKRVPLGRFACPQEVADAALHLASEQASYANGMSYVLDGGTTAGTFA